MLPAARLEGGQLKVIFRRLKSPPDVAYRLEIATELNGDWNEAGGEAGLRVIGSSARSETVEAVFPDGVGAEDALYLRIVALPMP